MSLSLAQAEQDLPPATRTDQLFHEIKPMLTTRDRQEFPQIHDPDLRSPLNQESVVWHVVPTASLQNNCQPFISRSVDQTGILDDLSAAIGPATAMCILGNNMIGAASWEQIPLADQYRAVTEGAGAFVASSMYYLCVRGPDAAAVLNMLTPRNIRNLAVGKAMFVLFTTPAGTIDEEAVVLRTAPEEYLISCGGGKTLSSLPQALKMYPRATAEPSDMVSFNLKGPQRLDAMQSLVGAGDRRQVAKLSPFEACHVQTPEGDQVWVLRTVVGLEMWGPAPVIRMTWRRILQHPERITPCAWDILNVYRMECTSMVFAVYPLDAHGGTTLWETGYGWMIEKGEDEFFVGQDALKQSRGREKLWLGGLMAQNETAETPPVGAEIYTSSGEFTGYVSSAAFSIKFQRALAFAHLKPGCRPGDTLTIAGDQQWQVRSLPFTEQ